MTNETLELICRNTDISVGIPIGDVGIILDVIEDSRTCRFEYLRNGELTLHGWNFRINGKPLPNGYFGYKDIIILLDDITPVGIVFPMGESDLHVLVLEEYQGKGIMSDFMSSGIVHQLNPGLSSITTNISPRFELEMYSKIKHLASKVGLELRISN
ncbi:MAG: hypothetical protein GX995_08315 [Clostridiales bacterium]|nr:hypothetical protein [Clostridiales bacterium]